MDKSRIEKEFRRWADDDTNLDLGPCDVKDFAESIAALARNEALEEAAKICDEQGGLTADVAAMRIRVLKIGSM